MSYIYYICIDLYWRNAVVSMSDIHSPGILPFRVAELITSFAYNRFVPFPNFTHCLEKLQQGMLKNNSSSRNPWFLCISICHNIEVSYFKFDFITEIPFLPWLSKHLINVCVRSNMWRSVKQCHNAAHSWVYLRWDFISGQDFISDWDFLFTWF